MPSNLQAGAYAQVVLPLTAVAAISLRFWLRTKFGHKLRWEDYIMLAAVLMSCASWAIWTWVRTIIGDKTYSELSPSERGNFWKVWFAFANIYTIASFVVKISILLFFIRAFGTTRTTKSIVWIILGLNTIYFVMRFAGSFLICHPLRLFWEDQTKCNNSSFWHSFYIILECIGLFLELAILVFPMPYVMLLRQPLRTRLAICSVFAIGLATCLSAAMRIYLLQHHLFALKSLGIDAPTANIYIATDIELNLGILAGCLATIRSPLSKQAGIWWAEWRRKIGKRPMAEALTTNTSSKAGLVELRITEIRTDVETQTSFAAAKDADDALSPSTPQG